MSIHPLVVSSLIGWGLLGSHRGMKMYDYNTNPHKYFFKDRITIS
jgi:hypothetical protein